MGVILVFDLTDETTFTSLANWITNINQYSGENISKILLGNKCDLADIRVSADKVTQFARDNKIPYFETSAKTSKNINEAFMLLARDLKKRFFESGMEQSFFDEEHKPAQQLDNRSKTTDGNGSSPNKDSCC
jgi:GTPase SAR1 family protein